MGHTRVSHEKIEDCTKLDPQVFALAPGIVVVVFAVFGKTWHLKLGFLTTRATNWLGKSGIDSPYLPARQIIGFRGHYHIYRSFAASRPKRCSRSGSERNKFDPLPARRCHNSRASSGKVDYSEKVLTSRSGRLSWINELEPGCQRANCMVSALIAMTSPKKKPFMRTTHNGSAFGPSNFISRNDLISRSVCRCIAITTTRHAAVVGRNSSRPIELAEILERVNWPCLHPSRRISSVKTKKRHSTQLRAGAERCRVINLNYRCRCFDFLSPPAQLMLVFKLRWPPARTLFLVDRLIVQIIQA